MRELVVISGKGGTGKTSLVASFAALAERAVLADCDVDAADLHLILDPTIETREPFVGGQEPHLHPARCTGCGECVKLCRFGAIHRNGQAEGSPPEIDMIDCEGCGVCARFCPERAIEMRPAVNGEWFVSSTRFGPMVHARLGIAQENSGKLVTLVRQQARFVAVEKDCTQIIVDGSPGIGCPVIASITGADMVLAVTEPTKSGLHDLDRVAQLARHFSVPMCVVINKWDLNPDMADAVEESSTGWGADVLGRIRYDPAVTTAQIAHKSIVEQTDEGIGKEIRQIWKTVSASLDRVIGEKAERAVKSS